MSSFKIISMNCRGLADFKKRKDVFMHLRKFKADIICLQDVHVAEGKENSFRNAWGHHSVIAAGTNNSRGVAILTGKNRPISISEVELDPAGNFVVSKVLVDELELILVCLYGPNQDCPDFFKNIGSVAEEKSGNILPIILVGDFNIALEQDLDTCNYVKENNPHAKRELKDVMAQLELVDEFRERNADLRRFTWRRHGPTVKQARLDFFWYHEAYRQWSEMQKYTQAIELITPLLH